MRYAKLAFLAFMLSVLPALTLVNALADEKPAEPPKAEEKAPAAPPKEAAKPPAADVQPTGPAFDQLKRLQAAGYDKLYYIIIRNLELVGWAKSELAIGMLDNQPVIEQTLTTSFTEYMTRQELKTEGKYCYNGKFEIQSLTESATKQNQTSTVKATRDGKTLTVEFQQPNAEAKKSEVIVEGLPDPPLNVYALALRYFENPMGEGATITILNDNDLANFATATAQPIGKMTAITDDIRLAKCFAYFPDKSNRFVLDTVTGIVIRKDIALNMQVSSAQFIVDKATFDNFVVNGKWNEAMKAIARNIATLLPPPAKPIPDWNAKRAELEKHWKELADKIPAETVEEMKTFRGQIFMIDPKNITQEQKDKLAKFGDNLTYYILAQALNDADQNALQIRFSGLIRIMQILFPAELPQEVRDSLVSTLYDEQHANDTNLPGFLAKRAWDADMQDLFIDRIRNTKSEAFFDLYAQAAFEKQPAWADKLGLYMLTNNTGWGFAVVTIYMGPAAQKPLYIGLLLERCRLRLATNSEDVPRILDAILGQKPEGVDGFAFYNEFYCKWHTALFPGPPPSADIKKKADELFVKLDDKNLNVRTNAKKDLVAMGKVILPLLEAQRDNSSAEVRQAVGDITDQIVAPGFSTTVDFIRKNQFDRNIAVFIGYLACQMPSMRSLAAARLKALTGQDFGEDIAKWYQWYDANKDKLKWNKDKNMWTVG